MFLGEADVLIYTFKKLVLFILWGFHTMYFKSIDPLHKPLTDPSRPLYPLISKLAL